MSLLEPETKPGGNIVTRFPIKLRGKHIGAFPVTCILIGIVLVVGILVYSAIKRMEGATGGGGTATEAERQVENLSGSSGVEAVIQPTIEIDDKTFAELGIDSVVPVELVAPEVVVGGTTPLVLQPPKATDEDSLLDDITNQVLDLGDEDAQLISKEQRAEALRLARSKGSAVDMARYQVKEDTESNPETPVDTPAPRQPTRESLANNIAAITALNARNNSGAVDDPNFQSNKEKFIGGNSPSTTGYNESLPRRPVSPYEIKAGFVIPATLLTEVNSDLPGWAIAQVAENVYDSATGEHLLIPQGSRLLGVYDARIAFGQKRSLMVWNRLVFPNGNSLELGGMVAGDKSGATGLKDKVNSHNIRIFGSVLLLSLFQGVPSLLEDEKADVADNEDTKLEELTAANVTQLGLELTRRNLARQATLIIRQGFEFNVLVHQDMLFHNDYRYQ